MEKLKKLLVSDDSEFQGIENFRSWVIAFVVANFNVDVGPEIEIVYPPSTPFTTADLSAICFNSFPERQDAEAGGDLAFHFELSNNSPDLKLSSPHYPYGSTSELYGSCIFRQEFDHESKRSFNQKSMVLISNHRFSSFYSTVLQHMASSGTFSDPSVLEAAFTEISAWPAPRLGRLELPFMGSMMVLETPPHQAFPLQGLTGALPPRMSVTHMPAIFAYEPTGHWDTIIPYMGSLSDLYVVYESLLICETVVVVSKSPQLVSDFISMAVDLIKPVPFNGGVKPYVTMQSDFQSVGLDGGQPRPFIIGITNPFLVQRMMDAAESLGRGKPTVVHLQDNKAQLPIKRSHSHRHRPQPSFDMPGKIELYSNKKTCLKADRAFTQALDTLLARAAETSEDEVTPFVRRHYAELTAQFLSPINRFLATSVSPADSSAGNDLHYANFSQSAFLHSLSKHGTSVKFRGQGPIQRHRARDALYVKFCQSLNWHSWLQMKTTLEKEAAAGLLRTTTASAGSSSGVVT